MHGPRFTPSRAVKDPGADQSLQPRHAQALPRDARRHDDRPGGNLTAACELHDPIAASAFRKVPVPALARWLLGLGIAATLAANVTHGLGHLIGAAVAAWLAVALVGSYELLMMIIRSAQVPGAGTVVRGGPDWLAGTDPLQANAVQAFAAELAAGRVSSVRARSVPGCT